MSMHVLGIDPGLKGGISLIMDSGAPIGLCRPMPLTSEGIVDPGAIVCDTEALIMVKPVVFIEAVHAMPKQGVTSTFTFGKGYGQLIGMCQVKGWEYHLVRPQTWQKELRKHMPELDVEEKWTKDCSVAFCEQKYPSINLLATKRSIKPHDGMADAICIAHYGKLITELCSL